MTDGGKTEGAFPIKGLANPDQVRNSSKVDAKGEAEGQWSHPEGKIPWPKCPRVVTKGSGSSRVVGVRL
jgi:hypothetical protein